MITVTQSNAAILTVFCVDVCQACVLGNCISLHSIGTLAHVVVTNLPEVKHAGNARSTRIEELCAIAASGREINHTTIPTGRALVEHWQVLLA
jgi:hypothetical protein